MIQDIAPHTYHNEYKPSAPDKNSFILAYEKGSILLPHQEREADIYFPRFQDLEEKVSDLYSKYIYLFSIDDQRFYLIPELDTTLLPDYKFQDIRNMIQNSWDSEKIFSKKKKDRCKTNLPQSCHNLLCVLI